MKSRIEQDDNAESPRGAWCCNIGVMVCFHSRYNLGDEPDVHGLKSTWFAGWDEMEAHLRRPCDEDDPEGYLGSGEGAIVVLPLYLYDHSGITMNTTGFSCQWDSGQVGFIYATAETVRKIYGDKSMTIEEIEAQLKAEVATYDQYLTGDVWGFIIEDDDGEHIDSCWGFFGEDNAKAAATEAMEELNG